MRQAVTAITRILTADSDEDATVLDGAAPEIEQLIMAAGTISFFGTRRVVVLPEIDPAAYSDKDLEELNSTLSSLEMLWLCWEVCLNWSAASSKQASAHRS